MRISRKQSGFALLMVLILLASAAMVGTGLLLHNSVKMAGASNLTIAERARYMAESGLQHGLFLLQNNPASLKGSGACPLGPYYVDDSAYGYYLRCVQDADFPELFYLTSEATIDALTRQCTLTVSYRFNYKRDLPHGIFMGGGQVTLPGSLRVNGDIHSNGNMMNLSWINGNVSTSGTLWDPYWRIRGNKSWASPKAVPDIKGDYYSQYQVSGLAGTAQTQTISELGIDNIANDGKAITPENPGGVVIIKPSNYSTYIKIKGRVKFKGTLVIQGDLVLDGHEIEITPQEGFPAIIVTGKVYVDSYSSTEINGLVVAPKGVAAWGSGNAYNSVTKINGGLVCEVNGYSSSMLGYHELNYQSDRCSIYDFGAASGEVTPGGTIRVLDYD